MSRPTLRIGLIGSGFMGKAHAFAYGTAAKVFDLPFDVELHTLADAHLAQRAARALGFASATDDCRAMVASPEIDVVHITAPNALHKEMALAAIAAGKHVHCEKPLAPRAADAREMADAAGARGVKTQLGFNYLCNLTPSRSNLVRLDTFRRGALARHHVQRRARYYGPPSGETRA